MKEIHNYQRIKEEYLSGSTLMAVAKKYNVERHFLSKKFKGDGVVLRNSVKKYECNSTFFDKIDSEEKAYWLGFLYADGYVNTTAKHCGTYVTLQYRDIEHLKKLRDVLSPTSEVKIKKDVIRGGKTFKYCALNIYDRHLSTTLSQQGCPPKKSLTLRFPGEVVVPSELLHHFIRGYFDGDGSVYVMYNAIINVSFIGTRNFMSNIQALFEKHISGYTRVKVHRKSKTCKVFYFSKGGADTIKAIYEYLYKDAHVYMERKKQKFVNFFAARASNCAVKTAEKIWNPETGIRPEGEIDYSI